MPTPPLPRESREPLDPADTLTGPVAQTTDGDGSSVPRRFVVTPGAYGPRIVARVPGAVSGAAGGWDGDVVAHVDWSGDDLQFLVYPSGSAEESHVVVRVDVLGQFERVVVPAGVEVVRHGDDRASALPKPVADRRRAVEAVARLVGAMGGEYRPRTVGMGEAARWTFEVSTPRGTFRIDPDPAWDSEADPEGASVLVDGVATGPALPLWGAVARLFGDADALTAAGMAAEVEA